MYALWWEFEGQLEINVPFPVDPTSDLTDRMEQRVILVYFLVYMKFGIIWMDVKTKRIL